MKFIKVEHELGGKVAIVTLNRPESMNALNKQLGEELAEALANLRGDDTLRAVIITGAGKAFSAGVDLKDPIFADPQVMSREWLLGPKSYFWQMQQFKVPLIAAVNGACVTGAMEIALQCDIIVASTNAIFRDTHSTYGIPPAGGMSQILQRMIGVQRARFMSLTGAKVDGRTAAAWGLASCVVEPSELMLKCLGFAEAISGKDKATLSVFRELINEGQGRGMRDALVYEVDHVLDRYREMGKQSQGTHSHLSSTFKAQQTQRSRL